MMQLIIAILSGLLFGAGLAASDMNNPERVQSFLDVFGQWDPSLMFVMLGALAIALPCIQLILKYKKHPILIDHFHLPKKHQIDKPLIQGAIVFGMGWAMVGYCPGPAIASLAYGYSDVVIFIIAMMLGAKLHRWQKNQ